MLRLIVVICSLALSTPAAHADAEGVRNRIVSILKEDGYLEIRISRTLLGRMRFVAMRADAKREIVVDPNSGVILRDYVRILNQLGGSSSGSGKSGSSREEYDDDYDDDDDEESGNSGSDDDDDDDDDDNSGSGSSNSGRDGDDDDD